MTKFSPSLRSILSSTRCYKGLKIIRLLVLVINNPFDLALTVCVKGLPCASPGARVSSRWPHCCIQTTLPETVALNCENLTDSAEIGAAVTNTSLLVGARKIPESARAGYNHKLQWLTALSSDTVQLLIIPALVGRASETVQIRIPHCGSQLLGTTLRY